MVIKVATLGVSLPMVVKPAIVEEVASPLILSKVGNEF